MLHEKRKRPQDASLIGERYSLEQCVLLCEWKKTAFEHDQGERRTQCIALLVELFDQFPAKNKAQDTSLWTISDYCGGLARLLAVERRVIYNLE